jgi:hypothetical protein
VSTVSSQGSRIEEEEAGSRNEEDCNTAVMAEEGSHDPADVPGALRITLDFFFVPNIYPFPRNQPMD